MATRPWEGLSLAFLGDNRKKAMRCTLELYSFVLKQWRENASVYSELKIRDERSPRVVPCECAQMVLRAAGYSTRLAKTLLIGVFNIGFPEDVSFGNSPPRMLTWMDGMMRRGMASFASRAVRISVNRCGSVPSFK
jgi:hypothetical protein